MDTDLKMVFLLDNDKTITMTLPDPNTGITISDLESGFAGEIVNDNMILYGGAVTTGLKEAYYYNTQRTIVE